MNQVKQISFTVFVVCFTALSFYALKMVVPESETEYTQYALKYHMYVSLSFAGICFCYYRGVLNRVIRAALIVNAGQFLILALKCFMGKAGSHNHYDNTILGCFIIYAFIYLVTPYIKPFLTLTKTIANQLYMRWITKHQRKNHGSS
jgi:hypothetical protein